MTQPARERRCDCRVQRRQARPAPAMACACQRSDPACRDLAGFTTTLSCVAAKGGAMAPPWPLQPAASGSTGTPARSAKPQTWA